MDETIRLLSVRKDHTVSAGSLGSGIPLVDGKMEHVSGSAWENETKWPVVASEKDWQSVKRQRYMTFAEKGKLRVAEDEESPAVAAVAVVAAEAAGLSVRDEEVGPVLVAPKKEVLVAEDEESLVFAYQRGRYVVLTDLDDPQGLLLAEDESLERTQDL